MQSFNSIFFGHLVACHLQDTVTRATTFNRDAARRAAASAALGLSLQGGEHEGNPMPASPAVMQASRCACPCMQGMCLSTKSLTAAVRLAASRPTPAVLPVQHTIGGVIHWIAWSNELSEHAPLPSASATLQGGHQVRVSIQSRG